MKNLKTSVFILSALSLVLCLSFIASDKWFLIQSKKYGYKIEFPKKPTEQTQSIDSEVGKLQLNMFLYDASEEEGAENLLYLSNCTEYPLEQVNADNPEILDNFYRGGIDGAVKNVKGKLLSEKKITLEGHEGREATVDYQEGLAIITMRLFLIKNKMYMVQTIAESSKSPNKSATKFFDSFKLLK